MKVRRRQNLVAVSIYAASGLVALLSPVVAIVLFSAVSLAYLAPTFLAVKRDE